MSLYHYIKEKPPINTERLISSSKVTGIGCANYLLATANCSLYPTIPSLFIGLFVVVHSKVLAECFRCVPGSVLRTKDVETRDLSP